MAPKLSLEKLDKDVGTAFARIKDNENIIDDVRGTVSDVKSMQTKVAKLLVHVARDQEKAKSQHTCVAFLSGEFRATVKQAFDSFRERKKKEREEKKKADGGDTAAVSGESKGAASVASSSTAQDAPMPAASTGALPDTWAVKMWDLVSKWCTDEINGGGGHVHLHDDLKASVEQMACIPPGWAVQNVFMNPRECPEDASKPWVATFEMRGTASGAQATELLQCALAKLYSTQAVGERRTRPSDFSVKLPGRGKDRELVAELARFAGMEVLTGKSSGKGSSSSKRRSPEPDRPERAKKRG